MKVSAVTESALPGKFGTVYSYSKRYKNYALNEDVEVRLSFKAAEHHLVFRELVGMDWFQSEDKALTIRRTWTNSKPPSKCMIELSLRASKFRAHQELWDGPTMIPDHGHYRMLASLFHDLMFVKHKELGKRLGLSRTGVYHLANKILYFIWSMDTKWYSLRRAEARAAYFACEVGKFFWHCAE